MLHSDNSYACLRDNNSVCILFKENNKTHTRARTRTHTHTHTHTHNTQMNTQTDSTTVQKVSILYCMHVYTKKNF